MLQIGSLIFQRAKVLLQDQNRKERGGKMLRFQVVVCAALLLLGGATMAGAAPITLTDTTQFTPTGTILPEDYVGHGWGDVNLIGGFGDYVKWTHHFEFDPAAAAVLSGELALSLRDDQQTVWKWTFDDLAPEFGIGWGEDFTWDIGEVDTGVYSYSVTASFLSDGDYTVTVASLGGDFYVD
jgi:hypothetical protein